MAFLFRLNSPGYVRLWINTIYKILMRFWQLSVLGCIHSSMYLTLKYGRHREIFCYLRRHIQICDKN